jgi:hypothetical protein
LIGSLVIALNLISLFIFPACAAAGEVTIAWDPNSEDDLEGYAVYKKESSSSAFNFIDTLPIDEIEDPSNPMVTITELEDDSKYYFSVTAFDIEGNESDYSNELCVQLAGLSVTECRSADGGDSGGANSGGGGGGCFITNSGAGFSPKAGIIAMIIVLGFFVYFLKRPLNG